MQKKSFRILSFALAILMILSAAPLSGFADIELPSFGAVIADAKSDFLMSGFCGDTANGGNEKDISWVLSEDGVLTVTGTGRIAPEAFNYDLRIKEVIIGDGITNVSSYCFSQCTNLTKVTLGKDVETIESYAFYSCSSLKDITFPAALTSIGDYAFADCYKLTEITFPDGLISIEYSAFNDCDGLTEITIPDSVKSIKTHAFGWCAKLTDVTIGAGVTSLSQDAFYSCDNLSSITVDENNSTYASQDGIVYNKAKTKLYIVPAGISGEITIPATVEEFTYNAVDSCDNLTAIHVENGSEYFKSVDGIVYTADGKTLVVCPRAKTGAVSVADGTEKIGTFAFYYCGGITSATLPDSVTSIGSYAFYYCVKLSDITFPDGLISIGEQAFYFCDSLTEITIPDSVKSIEIHAFSGCSALTDVTIGAGVTSLSQAAFNSCDNLSSITVDENNSTYASQDGIVYNKAKTKLYIVPAGISGEITIPATVEEFTYDAVFTCDKITAIHVENGSAYFKSVDGIVYTADGKILVTCPRAKTGVVSVADGTEKIGNNAFAYCDGLTEVTLPDSVTSIGSDAFYWCSKLKSINIPAAITKINNSIFAACGFTELTFPETVQSFDHASWRSLKTFTIENRYCEYTSTYAPSFHKDCVIRAYCGSPGHVLAIKRLLGFETLGHTYLNWYVYQPATFESEGIERRDCAYCDGYDERIIPKLESDVYTATFVADGEVIATVDFPKGATSIAEPKVPAKDRYIGEWEDYTLSNADITINAVYTLIKSDDASEIQTESNIVHYTDKDDVLFRLRAWANATVVKSTVSKSVPLDIVIVVDQSGSMDDTLNGRTKKVDALKDTAKDFVNTILENAKMTGADHRISIVGFGLSGTTSGYEKNENSELLTSANGIVRFDRIKTTDYASSLLSVNVNGEANEKLITAINSIGARGATAADLGFEMAKGVFANTDSTGRQRVVIFMTDGEPTYSSNFSTSVANAAIANASLLKKAYDASIYSVGVFSSKSNNVDKFMNAVSSGYPDAESLSYMGKGVDGQFYLTVDNTDALTSVFKSISTESLSHTAPFDNLTFIKTLSEYVTLTMPHEEQLRIDLIRKYGITDNDIIITRNDDGTTTIQINGLTPYETTDAEGNVIYEVYVEFFASLNDKAATPGDYVVDTEDSGVMLGKDALGYEATFDTSTITLTSKKTRVIFTINGDVYDISTNISNGYAVAPEIEIAPDWIFSGWDTTSQKAYNGLVLDATLTKADRKITWHTADGDIVQYYVYGAIITAPTVDMNANGDIFLSWDKSIPTTMPDENLEFTAIYGKHVHSYTSDITKKMTCETDGIRTYTCFCGDTYTEVIPASGHNYQAITPSLDKTDAKCTFCCTNCGDKYDYALDYEVVESTGKKYNVLYEFNLTDDELNTNIQPDGAIQIKIPLSELHGSAEHVTVFRYNEDGTKTQVPAVHEKGFLIITCDHFTPYEVIFDIPCEAHIRGDWEIEKNPTCAEEGLRQIRCTECEKVIEEEVIAKTKHVNEDDDSACDVCGEKIKTVDKIIINNIYDFFEAIKAFILRLMNFFVTGK